MRCLAALFIAGTLFVSPQQERSPQEVLDSFVVSGENAYYVAAPRLLLSGNVVLARFSDDGSYGVLVGYDTPRESSIKEVAGDLAGVVAKTPPKYWVKVWDVRHDRLTLASKPVSDFFLLREDPESTEIDWTSEPGVFLSSFVSDGTQHVLRCNLATGLVGEIGSGLFATNEPRLVSPLKPVFVTYSATRNKPMDPRDLKTTLEFTVCRLDGTVTKSGKATVRGEVFLTSWTPDGLSLVGKSRRVEALGAPKINGTVVLDTRSGQVTETQETIAVYSSPEPQLDLQLQASQAKLGDTVRLVQNLWLVAREQSDRPRALIGAGVDWGVWLAPSMDKVAFCSNGQWFVSDILKMDLKSFNAAVAAAERSIAMMKVKQVGLAVNIYSTDYDDFLPTQANFHDGVMPYLKNESLLQGFVYTFTGSDAKSVERPAETEMGYIKVRGGRCVVYLDSHARFVPDP